jgi:hypothetical protein
MSFRIPLAILVSVLNDLQRMTSFFRAIACTARLGEAMHKTNASVKCRYRKVVRKSGGLPVKWVVAKRQWQASQGSRTLCSHATELSLEIGVLACALEKVRAFKMFSHPARKLLKELQLQGQLSIWRENIASLCLC